MSWFGWGAKPKTDLDLMEKLMTKEDKKYYEIIDKYFKSQGYETEMNALYPDTLQRFITGYAHCQEREKETKEKIQHFLDTYRQYKFNTILDDVDDKEKDYCQAWPLFAYGYDKYAHPVYYDCVGDSKEDVISKIFQINDVTDDSQFKHLMNYKYTFMRRLHNCKRAQSDKEGKMIYKHLLVFDVKNVSLSYSEFTGMKAQFAKKVIGSDQDMFPDSLYRLYIINASLTFRAIWKLLRSFADPITAEKIQVLGSDYLKDLTKQVPIDQIPKEYGGKGKWDIKYGFVADLEDDHYPARKDKNEKNTNKNNDDAKEEEANNNNTNNNDNDNNNSNDKNDKKDDNTKNSQEKSNDVGNNSNANGVMASAAQ